MGGGGNGGSAGGGGSPLLPHAYLQWGCVSGCLGFGDMYVILTWERGCKRHWVGRRHLVLLIWHSKHGWFDEREACTKTIRRRWHHGPNTTVSKPGWGGRIQGPGPATPPCFPLNPLHLDPLPANPPPPDKPSPCLRINPLVPFCPRPPHRSPGPTASIEGGGGGRATAWWLGPRCGVTVFAMLSATPCTLRTFAQVLRCHRHTSHGSRPIPATASHRTVPGDRPHFPTLGRGCSTTWPSVLWSVQRPAA